MRLPPGLCPGPRRGACSAPQTPIWETLGHTLAEGPAELRARNPIIRHWRQPLQMAHRACNCWFFFISNKFNVLMFNMEYAI